LLVDLGSTYTKVVSIDLDKEIVLGRAQEVSTVTSDVMVGLRSALRKLQTNGQLNTRKLDKRLACSSAAGGLQMIVVGLVPGLTVEAGRQAALGAGAKLIGAYSYELTSEDVKAIERAGADILLLCGGTDGGDKDVIIHNAKALAKSHLSIPIIAAGNRAVSTKVRGILESSDKTVTVTENVLPDIHSLNVEPVRAVIRRIFIDRIVKAKGFSRAQKYIGSIIMPTPMAVLKGAQLLAEGTEEEPGLGELMVIDVGGTTTDVHSIAAGRTAEPGVIMRGLPEPYAKRTVEGDLGIRYNGTNIVDIFGEKKILEDIHNLSSTVTCRNIRARIEKLSQNIGFVPENEEDFLIDTVLGRGAVDIAVNRHVATLQQIFTPNGPAFLLYGKDLTEIKTVIGTGGVFVYAPHPDKILQVALFNSSNPLSLRPKDASLYIDKSYILYAVGLLSDIIPTKALRIMKKYLEKVS
jgi:uncharacterized protein (TIGR01319 family)